jgi:hypothetical protein
MYVCVCMHVCVCMCACMYVCLSVCVQSVGCSDFIRAADRGSFPEIGRDFSSLLLCPDQLALGYFQPPIQWVPGTMSLGDKAAGF